MLYLVRGPHPVSLKVITRVLTAAPEFLKVALNVTEVVPDAITSEIREGVLVLLKSTLPLVFFKLVFDQTGETGDNETTSNSSPAFHLKDKLVIVSEYPAVLVIVQLAVFPFVLYTGSETVTVWLASHTLWLNGVVTDLLSETIAELKFAVAVPVMVKLPAAISGADRLDLRISPMQLVVLFGASDPAGQLMAVPFVSLTLGADKVTFPVFLMTYVYVILLVSALNTPVKELIDIAFNCARVIVVVNSFENGARSPCAIQVFDRGSPASISDWATMRFARQDVVWPILRLMGLGQDAESNTTPVKSLPGVSLTPVAGWLPRLLIV